MSAQESSLRSRRHRRRAWMGAVFTALLFGAMGATAGVGKPERPVDPSQASARERATLEQRFGSTVRPFLRTFCVSCHGAAKPAAQLDLSTLTNLAAATRSYPHLLRAMEKLVTREMPPKSVARQPSAAVRQAVIEWIKDLRRYETERNAGDPGHVPPRRLSNAEYDYTIRDLTGADIRPTREFPVDPANQEGFDNSAESLSMSPALMKKYMQASKQVADHLVLQPSGIGFAPHPALVDTDRDKYCILRIVDFYKRQPTQLADYFLAAWRFLHRNSLGMPQARLDAIAAQSAVSPRYLDLVWQLLSDPNERVGPTARLQAMWRELPPPTGQSADSVRPGCIAMQMYVQRLRKKLAWRFENLKVPPGFSAGGQCFVLWKDRQYATHRRELYEDALQPDGQPKPRTVSVRVEGGGRRNEVVVDPVDPELFVPGMSEPQAVRDAHLASFRRFCSVFPDAFYISERGRMFLDDPNDRGRLLSAGFHNQMGYFRDDSPLSELILDEQGRRELDRLWLEFDFIASVPERMHVEFIFYERAESGTMKSPEFDFARSEDKDATSDAKIRRLAEVYLAKARRGLAPGDSPVTLEAIQQHFHRTSVNIRAIQQARLAAEPSHLVAALDFARRAFRRPLTAAERSSLEAFYKALRTRDGLNHEDAMRDVIASVLMSPHFLFLGTEGTAGTGTAAGRVTQPLSGHALASRLSYFLWSSMPDEQLLAHAAAGDLQRPDVLTAQTRRMLRDPRVRALALEFGGNWLDFRRFEQHNAVDRERFPTFNDELRQAMFEEPVRFLVDAFQGNRSVLEMLYGRHTFVNAALARHYKMDDVKPAPKEWQRVDDADRYARGGLLPMAVFLTYNSPGLRTSPVKRGYWMVRRVLGEHIPAPPPVVPELPRDEGKLGDRTLRQVLEQHRQHPACAGCHARFDSFGLVFENYGPIGELRTRDLGGKPVDTRAVFPGGAEESGLTGLREFVRARREGDFVENLSRKLLAYGLGRSLLPSDEPLLTGMRRRLAGDGNRIGAMIDSIVTSTQFRTRRAPQRAAGTLPHGVAR